MKPLFLLLTHAQAIEGLRARNGMEGPFKGDFEGWYYQWERGGRLDGPHVNLETAIAAAEKESKGREVAGWSAADLFGS